MRVSRHLNNVEEGGEPWHLGNDELASKMRIVIKNKPIMPNILCGVFCLTHVRMVKVSIMFASGVFLTLRASCLNCLSPPPLNLVSHDRIALRMCLNPAVWLDLGRHVRYTKVLVEGSPFLARPINAPRFGLLKHKLFYEFICVYPILKYTPKGLFSSSIEI